MNIVADAQDSILASISGIVAPVFAPLGLNDWRVVTALVAGFMAKESVVSTLEILYLGNVNAAMNAASAASTSS